MRNLELVLYHITAYSAICILGIFKYSQCSPARQELDGDLRLLVWGVGLLEAVSCAVTRPRDLKLFVPVPWTKVVVAEVLKVKNSLSSKTCFILLVLYNRFVSWLLRAISNHALGANIGHCFIWDTTYATCVTKILDIECWCSMCVTNYLILYS